MTARPEPLRLALAQIDATVGDIDANAERIRAQIADAREEQAALVVFPELALTGYPPEDLLLKEGFLERARDALGELAEATRGLVALVGFPERGDDVYNAAGVLADGELRAVYRKLLLPNYGVFDERRYFQAGDEAAMIALGGTLVGVTICEDIWEPGPPATSAALAGAHLIVNLSASPYHAGKGAERERMLAQRARDSIAGFALCNMVGGQDELVFDGHSVVVDQDGELLARGPQFEETLVVCTFDPAGAAARRLQDPRRRSASARPRATTIATIDAPAPDPGSARDLDHPPAAGEPPSDRGSVPLLDADAEVYAALVTGLRGYVDKNGFDGVVVGLSGGIDSAVTAVVAVDALGGARVTCVSMPSRYSSEGTRSDAEAIARRLETDFAELPIEGPVEAIDAVLATRFRGTEPGIAEENIQARVRGLLVMALSNKFGRLVLTTGNKSELSVGYATLYGDMAGGFSVLKDVFKGDVYRLARWRNARARTDGATEPIPASVLERPPSAELRHEQRDEDSLPSYELLDRILEAYVERDLDADGIVRLGLPEHDVERVIRLVDGAEYKRRQAPPGIRISAKAFGRDRRLPITNLYR